MERAEQEVQRRRDVQELVRDAETNYQLALNKQVTPQRNLAVFEGRNREHVRSPSGRQARGRSENAQEDFAIPQIVSPMDGLVSHRREYRATTQVSSIWLLLGSQATW